MNVNSAENPSTAAAFRRPFPFPFPLITFWTKCIIWSPFILILAGVLFRFAENYVHSSQLLVDLAKSKGSEDNITVIVVFLTEPRNVVRCDIDMETAAAAESTSSAQQNGTINYRPLSNFDPHSEDEDEELGPETFIDFNNLGQDSKEVIKCFQDSWSKEQQEDVSQILATPPEGKKIIVRVWLSAAAALRRF